MKEILNAKWVNNRGSYELQKFREGSSLAGMTKKAFQDKTEHQRCFEAQVFHREKQKQENACCLWRITRWSAIAGTKFGNEVPAWVSE